LTPWLKIGDLAPGETRTWNNVLHDPILVRGRVLGEHSGRPVKDVDVECRRDGLHLPADLIQPTSVNVAEDGHYEFKLLTGPGRYSFAANYIGLPFHGDSLTSDSGEQKRFEGGLEYIAQEVELNGGEEIMLDLSIPDPCTILAKLVDSEGTPLPDAGVRVRIGSGWHGPNVRTDAEGRCSFSGFPPGVEGWLEFEGNSDYAEAQTDAYVGEPGQTIPDAVIVVEKRAEAASAPQ
jgi:hypothetical protein